MTQLIEKLHEKGIGIKTPTLIKYLSEARRQREGRKAQERDTRPTTGWDINAKADAGQPEGGKLQRKIC